MAQLFGEIRNLIKKISRVSNGQARIVEIGEMMNIIQIEISPNDGLYKGASFLFKIRVNPYELSTEAPTVICLTPVYHPNIDTSDLEDTDTSDDEEFNSNVCLNMLDDWQPSYGLDGLVNGLLFFFYHPEIDDPLSPYISPGMSSEEFSENVQRSLLGKEVDGFLFERNLCDSEYEILRKELADMSELIIEKCDPVLPNPESAKDTLPKDSEAIVLPDPDSEISVVPNVDSETLVVPNVDSETLVVSNRESETLVVSNRESETLDEPGTDSKKILVSNETACEISEGPATENKNLLSNDTPSLKITTFRRFNVQEDFCSIKSFDRSVPESDIIHTMVDRFLRRFFCCHSDLSND